jgi:hypothetical protein
VPDFSEVGKRVGPLRDDNFQQLSVVHADNYVL